MAREDSDYTHRDKPAKRKARVIKYYAIICVTVSHS